VRGPGEVDRVVEEEQAGALFVLRRVKNHEAARAVVAGSGELSRDVDWAIVELIAAGSVESMQALVVISRAVLRHGHKIDDAVRTAGAHNHGRGGDANLGSDLAAAAIVGGGLTGLERGDVPDGRTGVGVEGIRDGAFGNHDQQIVRAASGGGNGMQI
jgi:hypothetical protein